MSNSHKNNDARAPKAFLKIATALCIGIAMAAYASLRWNTSELFSGIIFIAGSLVTFLSFDAVYTFIKNQLASEKVEKAYTIKAIIYLIIIWTIIFASGQSLWVFEADHEISICPGWSNDVEESSYPILVNVTNQGTKTDIPLSEFWDKVQKQYFVHGGQAIEIRDCVFYRYSDSEALERVSFQFLRGKEYLPVQVTGNDNGKVLDLDSGEGDFIKIALSPQFRYNMSTATFLQYLIRWVLLLYLALVFAFTALLAVRTLVFHISKLYDPGTLATHSQLILIQSGTISLWIIRKIVITWYLFTLIWLLVTLVTYVVLSMLSRWIRPKPEDADIHRKVILFAFCVSIALTLFIPLQPKDSFGIYSSSPLPNVIYNGHLVGKIAVLDLSLWAIFLLFTGKQRVYRPRKAVSRWWIVFYALPMMAVGFMLLLTFWPGIMNQDSLDQWMQVKAFAFDLANPIFHTLLTWLVTRVWMSPATVVSAQILGLSLTTGYALYRLDKIGLHKYVLAAAAVVAAIVPPNAFYVVMLCKDIPYAIAGLWLTIILVEIYYSKGQWIYNNKNTTLLVITITCAILLRYNGLIEMSALIILLLVVYRKTWHRWALAGVSAVALMFLMNLAFDQFLPKPAEFHDKSTFGAAARIIEHRLRAHIYSGTEIQQSESELLSKTLPSMAVIAYYNCHDSPLYREYYDPVSMLFDPENFDELIRAYIPLVLRAPWVEVRHQICNLSIFFRVYPRADEYQELVPVRIRPKSKELIYQVTPEYAELAGVSQDSKIPQLAWILGEYMAKVGRDRRMIVAPWRAAPYIFVIIIGLIFRGSIYEKDWKVLIIGGPVLVHLTIFAFGNVFSIFRFHYMILPIACILWPLLFSGGRIQSVEPKVNKKIGA